jgi:hypothetical protein
MPSLGQGWTGYFLPFRMKGKNNYPKFILIFIPLFIPLFSSRSAGLIFPFFIWKKGKIIG